MRRKSIGTCVLLLGLLLGTASSARADALAITSVSVNVQIVPTSGTIVFSLPEFSPGTTAFAFAENGFGDESRDESESLTRSEASANVTFASATAVSDFTNLSFNANSNVMLSGCLCSAESVGQTFLLENFMIVGGTGLVNVNFSALLLTMQTLITDQSSLFAASTTLIGLHVSDVRSFSFDDNLRIGPDDAAAVEIERRISEILTLEFNKEYSLLIIVSGNSRAAQNEIPEPATVVLLVSGLGFMTGFVRKRMAKQ